MATGSGFSRGTVKQTIVSNLEAPRLKGVSTKNFTLFLKERDLYEKQIAEKNKEPGVKISPVSYRASIDDEDLHIFITAKWIAAESLSEITEASLRDCVKARAVREISESQLGLINQVVKQVQMNMAIVESEDRVWSLHRHYLSVLKNAGFSDLIEKKPHIAIGHILKRVKPNELQKRMKDVIKWRKDDNFDRKDFGAFMRELATQAKRLEDEKYISGNHQADNDDISEQSDMGNNNASKFKQNNKGTRTNIGPTTWNKASNGKNGNGHGKRKRESDLPPCLNTKCLGRHFISDCPITSKDEQFRLRKEYRASKRQKIEKESPNGKPLPGKVKRLGAEAIDSHSSLFTAMLANGAVETVVMADQGSDINLIPPSVLRLIKDSGAPLQITHLTPPHIFETIGQCGKVSCDKKVIADVHLRIRHGTKLILRAVEWHVGNYEMEHVLLGRPTLDAIGCNNQVMLAAACDNNDGVINIPEALQKSRPRSTPKEGSIAALLEGGVFHSAGGCEEDGLDDEDAYIDLGDDSEEALNAVLEERVKDAISNGLSGNGASKLREIIAENKSVFD